MIPESILKALSEFLSSGTPEQIINTLNSFANGQILKEDSSQYLSSMLSKQQVGRLNRMIADTKKEISFKYYLINLIDSKHMKSNDVYIKSNISRQEFSKILNQRNNGKKYIAGKDIFFRIGLAMKLTHDEMDDLLKRVGYSFIASDMRDKIVLFFIEEMSSNNLSYMVTKDCIDDVMGMYKLEPLYGAA